VKKALGIFAEIVKKIVDGDLRAVTKLIDANKFDVNTLSDDGKTLLMVAAYAAKKDIIEFLIARGADVNLQDQAGDDALSLAGKADHREIGEYLIDKGAVVRMENRERLFALAETIEPPDIYVCLIKDEPHMVAVLPETTGEQESVIKQAVPACLFRCELHLLSEYPIIHLGLGIPSQILGPSKIHFSIVDTTSNFQNGNFQSWANAVKRACGTFLHIYGPDHRQIASGQLNLPAEIVTDVGEAVARSKQAVKGKSTSPASFRNASQKFYEQHPAPYIGKGL
jgi:hypothetical protein